MIPPAIKIADCEKQTAVNNGIAIPGLLSATGGVLVSKYTLSA